MTSCNMILPKSPQNLNFPWRTVICDATSQVTAKSQPNHDRIAEAKEMTDLFILSVAGLFLGILGAVTMYAAIDYRKSLRRAQNEYEKARDFVEDIVLSFNREIKREVEKTQAVAHKVEINSSKANASQRLVEKLEERGAPIETQINDISTQVEAMGTTVNSIIEVNEKTIEKLSETDISYFNIQLQGIESSQETLKSKIAELEGQIQKLNIIPEMKAETTLTAVPVMPIRRDKALAALTETEVTVLEFLSSEGKKTAPEIKEKVQLSREHTSRLMKKLYEEGYLERESVKLPFKYSIKKEMKKLLGKTETSAV